jgi:hypothetical protein
MRSSCSSVGGCTADEEFKGAAGEAVDDPRKASALEAAAPAATEASPAPTPVVRGLELIGAADADFGVGAFGSRLTEGSCMRYARNASRSAA